MKSLNNNPMQTLITRGIGILPIILSASAMFGFWQPLFAKTAPTSQSKPRIEVCFVLDTTGSMGGLIEGKLSAAGIEQLRQELPKLPGSA